MFYRNDNVRDFTETQKGIADVQPALQNFPEPLFVPVVLALEIIRADVTDLFARRVDYTQVGKTADCLLQALQDGSEVFPGDQFLKRVALDNKMQCIFSLFEKSKSGMETG